MKRAILVSLVLVLVSSLTMTNPHPVMANNMAQCEADCTRDILQKPFKYQAIKCKQNCVANGLYYFPYHEYAACFWMCMVAYCAQFLVSKPVDGSQGGFVALNGDARVDFPPGSFVGTYEIKITQLSGSPEEYGETFFAPPFGSQMVSHVYDFRESSGALRTFNPPATVTLPYDPQVSPDLINIYYYDSSNARWTKILTGRNVDTGTHRISASTTHFTPFVVLTPPAAVGYNTYWLIFTAISLMLAGGYLIFRQKRKLLVNYE